MAETEVSAEEIHCCSMYIVDDLTTFKEVCNWNTYLMKHQFHSDSCGVCDSFILLLVLSISTVKIIYWSLLDLFLPNWLFSILPLEAVDFCYVLTLANWIYKKNSFVIKNDMWWSLKLNPVYHNSLFTTCWKLFADFCAISQMLSVLLWNQSLSSSPDLQRYYI